VRNNGISSASPASQTGASELPASPRPDPEVVANAKRRPFTAEYKLGVLAEPTPPPLNPAPSAPYYAAKAFTRVALAARAADRHLEEQAAPSAAARIPSVRWRSRRRTTGAGIRLREKRQPSSSAPP
jgi:hypothetical protein